MNSELLDSAGMMKISDLLTYVAGMVAAQGKDPDSGNATDLERDLHAAAKSLARRAAYEAVIPRVSAPVDDNPPDSIHELIAAGMTGVSADMHKQLERLEQRNAECLRTVYEAINAVAGSAKPEIDRLTARIDELGDVLIKALMKIDALENKSAL